MKVSVIMPAHNEQDHISESVQKSIGAMRSLSLDFEVIVVDDGSSDNTAHVAEQLGMNPHLRVIRLPVNMGKGFALKTGFEACSGDIVTFVDSDADISQEQISTYVDAMRAGDILVASKWHPRSLVRIPFLRRVLSHVFELFVRISTGVRCSDTQSGLKAFRRKVLDDILAILVIKRYGFDVELLAAAQRRGYRFVELPISITMVGSQPLVSLFRMVSNMFIDVLKIAYRVRVLHMYDRR